MKLPTPLYIAEILSNEGFTEDQASTIAAEIYQPLKNSIKDLKKIISTLTVGVSTEIGIVAAKAILDELNDEI